MIISPNVVFIKNLCLTVFKTKKNDFYSWCNLNPNTNKTVFRHSDALNKTLIFICLLYSANEVNNGSV